MAALVDHRNYLADVLARQAVRRRIADPGHEYGAQPTLSHASSSHLPPSPPPELEAGPSKPSKTNVVNYVPAEEAVRNDYASWYGVSGEYPSNHVLGAGEREICEEFPALRRLMDLKAEHVAAVAHPPLVIPLPSTSASTVAAAAAPHRFDVILIHPTKSWAETAALPIRQLSADPGFVFLWVGTGDADGLERGRECLAKWGFRRAEDIVWVKTNKNDKSDGGGPGGGLFASQKEHCLMGIRGTVRRSTDSRFVHCNVDTDVIVCEQDAGTPPYIYNLIENFCLGSRRLELFSSASTPRRGWVTATLGPAPDTVQLFDGALYASFLPSKEEGKPVLPFHAEIDMLRPKSPQRRGAGGGGRGGRGPPTAPGSPPPTPPFRQGGSNVMRMGALTPAQGMGGAGMMSNFNPNQGMNQGMMTGYGQMNPAQNMMPGYGQMAGYGQAGMMSGYGQMPPQMLGYGQMPQMLPQNPQQMMAMQAMQAQMAQMQGMGMGGMQGMQMGPGMAMGMAMGVPGMNPNMSMMGGMSPGMLSPNIQQGMGSGMGSPYLGSPNMGHVQLEGEEQHDWSGHGQTMGQLAMGMGAMGMPYLGGGGYPYNG
ncbi:uncharacterized protein EHS24_005071 [Apiotrichum porosum]|uniref:Transcription regulator n=1 Tax=Apiotrichum porosum TaxID=105984 RepID=A0A427Y6T4_9TREE|nr:uncharacterized protein EHS24_005071 [Apiotrichum porosum]RSH86798.1 hypothetical protein EHS24_005071 [Apiotrichum porosum]